MSWETYALNLCSCALISVGFSYNNCYTTPVEVDSLLCFLCFNISRNLDYVVIRLKCYYMSDR